MERIQRAVNFNLKTEEYLLEYSRSINFSKFVKDALIAEMKKGKDVDHIKGNVPKLCRPLPTHYFQTKQGALIYFRLFGGIPHKWTDDKWEISSIQKTKLIDILW